MAGGGTREGAGSVGVSAGSFFPVALACYRTSQHCLHALTIHAHFAHTYPLTYYTPAVVVSGTPLSS